jgi:hypothetical protein
MFFSAYTLAYTLAFSYTTYCLAIIYSLIVLSSKGVCIIGCTIAS